MFSKSAAFYDAIYAAVGKDYGREVEILHALIQEHKRSAGNSLLDVACGTGSHILHLRQHYDVSGLDLDPSILKVARQRCPDVNFYQADMADFQLDHQFDVVTCLFSSIGYVKTVEGLGRAIATMKRHLQPDGLLVVEPWFAPDDMRSGYVHGVFVDQPDLKIARMSVTVIADKVSSFDFHYLVATPNGVEHFVEHHALGLFTHDEYLSAFHACGLEAIHDVKGLDERGLYLSLNV
ncbi:MAG: class I SAM-dependent methyltransferase [Chloroflexi bacterium]|nr:class I SAM-dependent methyltransferase [Chloroflexota bacterium]